MDERFPLRVAVAGFVLWGLSACQTRPPAGEIPPPPAPVVGPTIPAAGSHRYTVTPEESLLTIFVYRGGAMARLGHNHVIASHRLDGVVFVADERTQTRFDVRIPVNELTVDEPAMREQAGADFPPGVPQTARDGTLKNMLSEALLDGAKYPDIRLRAIDVVAAGELYDVGIEITLKDQVRNVRVPVKIALADRTLTASGDFALKQSDLGLKPFSIGMGALVRKNRSYLVSSASNASAP
jgi:polyisoprenoid-binding protein YceI